MEMLQALLQGYYERLNLLPDICMYNWLSHSYVRVLFQYIKLNIRILLFDVDQM